MTTAIPNLRDILLRARYLMEHLPDELKEAGAERMRALVAKLRPHLEREGLAQPAAMPEPQPEATPQMQVSPIAQQLWILANGNPDIFQAYMATYPDPQLNNIARNPAELNNVMNQVSQQKVEPQGVADGVTQAPLKSSNVFGFRYDPLKKRLTVRFNEGGVYRYEGVPRQIFEMFANGDGVAKTTGSNRWGRWWRGKKPSLGAALHELIKLGGFPYQRIR